MDAKTPSNRPEDPGPTKDEGTPTSPEKRAGSALAKFLSTPLVVTLVGGLAVAGAGSWLQFRSDEYSRAYARFELQRNHKFELFRSFANDFDLQLQRYIAYEQANVEAKFGQSTDPKALELLEKRWGEYYSKPPISSMWTQTQAFFVGDRVRNCVKSLKERVGSLEKSVRGNEPSAKLIAAESAVTKARDELLLAMAAEERELK